MNNVRQHPGSMVGLGGGSNPPFLQQGGMNNLGMMNQNGIGQQHQPGGMQHPGHQLPMGLLQQPNHAGGGGPHPPPMGGLQAGNPSLAGQNLGQMGGAPGIQYAMGGAVNRQMLDRQALLQQHQQQQRQQLGQGIPGGAMGSLPNQQQHANMSGLGGGPSGMGSLGQMAGGQMSGLGNGIPNLQQMSAQLQQGMAMRRVPSTNQPQQPQQVGGTMGQPQQGMGGNMNMNMGFSVLRQGGMLQGVTNHQLQQQMQHIQRGQPGSQPGGLQPHQGQQQLPMGAMGHPSNAQDGSRELPSNVAALMSQRQQNFGNTHPPGMSPGMPNLVSSVAPNAPGAQRAPSAQAMTPGHSGGPMGHPGAGPGHMNHTPTPQQQNVQNAQQPPFVNPLQQPAVHNMQPPTLQQQQHPNQQPGMPNVRQQGMPGIPMPGGQHGPTHSMPGHPNGASPPRSGTVSQPQTPALPMAAGAGRPQSRQGENNMMMGFPGAQGNHAMHNLGRPGQPGQQQPGPSMQSGPSYPPFGVPSGFGGRATPQNAQNPMAGLGSSPGGPGPGPGPAGMQPHQLTSGAPGRVGQVPSGTVPTPAGLLAANQAGGQRMAEFGHMPSLSQGVPTPLGMSNMVPPQRPPSQARAPANFTSPGVRPNQQVSDQAQASPQNGMRRQGTPSQQMPVGTPLMSSMNATNLVQQKRPPSSMAVPQPPQSQQAGPSRATPRSQPAPLPQTPGSAANVTSEGAYNVPVTGRVGLGISTPGHPNATPQQQHTQTTTQPPPSTPQTAPQHPQSQLQGQAIHHPQQRPPTRTGDVAPTTIAPTDNVAQAPGQGIPGMPVSRPPVYSVMPQTVAAARLQRFSDALSFTKSSNPEKYWNSVVNEYFVPHAMVKITLWKDNMQNEAKPFDISMPILPRFFLVTTESGVSSMSISLENAVERSNYGFGLVLESSTASWTFRYTNGYVVTLKGQFIATLVSVGMNQTSTLKFESITFDSKMHEKALRIEAIKGQRSEPMHLPLGTRAESTSTMSSPSQDEEKQASDLVVVINQAQIPAEPVNAFGIPQATMRCLELAESVGQMSELIEYSLKTHTGPLDALKGYAKQIRDQSHGSFPVQQNMNQAGDGTMNGVAASPAVTLYQSSPIPAHATAGGSHHPHHNLTNQGLQGSTSSPLMASTPASAQTPTAPPLSAGPSNSSHSTPNMQHANLKRKAGDTSSPTTNTEQAPPAKRAQRKRSVRQGGS